MLCYFLRFAMRTEVAKGASYIKLSKSLSRVEPARRTGASGDQKTTGFELADVIIIDVEAEDRGL